MKSMVRALLLILFAIIAIPFAIYLFISSKIGVKCRPARQVTEADIARAEKRLGFELPGELRSHFLGTKVRTARSCAELRSLKSAVDEYRMLTKRPYGPNGQGWPRDYFPVADLLPGYGLYDLVGGTIVEWDPEDLGEEDDDPRLWDRSFTETGMSLKQWLETAD